MATFTKKSNTTTNEGAQTQAATQELPRVLSCRLAHDAKRDWLVAYASVAFTGEVFINGIQVRESKNGNPYVLLPGYRRVDANGEVVKDENGYQQYVDYCNPFDKETRETMQNAIYDAVQQALDDADKVGKDIEVNGVKVRVYLRDQDNLVASVSVNMAGTWAMRGIQVLESKDGNAYLKFPHVYNKDKQAEYTHCGPGNKATKEVMDNLIMPAVQDLLNAE